MRTWIRNFSVLAGTGALFSVTTTALAGTSPVLQFNTDGHEDLRS